mgnify:CR=1 FL=1
MGEEFAPESPRGDSGAVCSLLVDAVVDDDADDRPDREDMDGPLMSRSTDLRRPRNPEDTSISVLLLLPALFPAAKHRRGSPIRYATFHRISRRHQMKKSAPRKERT